MFLCSKSHMKQNKCIAVQYEEQEMKNRLILEPQSKTKLNKTKNKQKQTSRQQKRDNKHGG